MIQHHSRKAARKRLAEILATVPAFVVTYDHQTKDFGRRSPVGMVHSDGTATAYPGYLDETHAFIVTILWRRDDAAATEDALDDLSAAVRQALTDHDAEPGLWDDLRLDEAYAVMDYPLIDNTQYRLEALRVLAHRVSES